jgi:hypothetical protein
VLFGCEKEKKLKEDPSGFRDMAWGTDIKTLSDMEFLKDEDVLKVYVKKNDKLAIGDVPLKAIYYKFFKGKLYEVVIETNGFKNYLDLKQLCFEKYGKGKEEIETDKYLKQEYYYWSGEKTSIRLSYLKASFITKDTVKLTLRSNKLLIEYSLEMLEQHRKKESEAMKDF